MDDLLPEDGVLEEVSAFAIKRVIAWQLREAMAGFGDQSPIENGMRTSLATYQQVRKLYFFIAELE